MCGIACLLDFDGPVDEAVLAHMCGAMRHRGPDARGLHVEPSVGLGIQRLAIIDVAGGDQPIFNEDGNLAVVLNGEIYNHEELAEGLRARGHRFSTRADTEVLLHLYEEHGDQLVRELRGMFAFALWDRRRQRLLCARDRAGKKPLFWARRGNRYWLASELRALLHDDRLDRTVDPQAVDAYLALQYVPDPLCILKGIGKLPSASTLVIDRHGPRVTRYWSLDYEPKLRDLPPAEAAERTRELLDEATRIRLMSERPVGAFLSGGIDSSAVVAAMANHADGRVKTFSIGFGDAAFDETRYARMVADRFSTDHHEFVVEPDALNLMPALARHYGEPFADPSAIATFYRAEVTSRHVTVALNGDGGDENFAGYGRYSRSQRLGRADWLKTPAKRLASTLAALGTSSSSTGILSRARRVAEVLGMEAWQKYMTALTSFERGARERLLTPEFRAGLEGWSAEELFRRAWCESEACALVDRMLDVDIHTYLAGDLLPKVDIATMAHSIEGRSPFLDHQLMEFAARLPAELKLGRDGSGKTLLRSAMQGVLPPEVLDRPKMGFGVPLARWFREDLRSLPADRLLDPSSIGLGYFKRQEIERLIAEHHAAAADHSLRLWVLLQFDTWHREVRDVPTRNAEPVP
jgi:asparagine synthase (glutamine-hydrolysing)